jgi:hypothetical protein
MLRNSTRRNIALQFGFAFQRYIAMVAQTCAAPTALVLGPIPPHPALTRWAKLFRAYGA